MHLLLAKCLISNFLNYYTYIVSDKVAKLNLDTANVELYYYIELSQRAINRHKMRGNFSFIL